MPLPFGERLSRAESKVSDFARAVSQQIRKSAGRAKEGSPDSRRLRSAIESILREQEVGAQCTASEREASNPFEFRIRRGTTR